MSIIVIADDVFLCLKHKVGEKSIAASLKIPTNVVKNREKFLHTK